MSTDAAHFGYMAMLFNMHHQIINCNQHIKSKHSAMHDICINYMTVENNTNIQIPNG